MADGADRHGAALALGMLITIQTLPAVKVELVDGPETADQPVSPRPARDLALAALLGLILTASGSPQ